MAEAFPMVRLGNQAHIPSTRFASKGLGQLEISPCMGGEGIVKSWEMMRPLKTDKDSEVSYLHPF